MMNRKQKKTIYRIAVSAVLLIAANLIPDILTVKLALFAAAYLVIGWDILRKAGLGIIHRRVFDECFLMAVATLGAIALSTVERSGDYNEAVAVMLFYQIGELFQSIAVGKSRRSIAELMDIRPDYANIEIDGRLERLDPDDVEIGTTVIIRPGERVPIDGVVVEGSAALNTAALTGESLPRDVGIGDEVISGCINMSGMLKVRTEKAFRESTVSRILELVENASSRKSRSESFISEFARVYTPAVCFAALALAVLPPVFSALTGGAATWSIWIYRALTFLVISCPCALVISIPLSFFAGLGGAGKAGILIKGSNYLEALSKVKTVVFDKTGTLTSGTFEVSRIQSVGMDAEKLIEYAACAECSSSHPIAQSIVLRYGREPDRSRVTEIEEISGHGITAKVDDKSVAVGNEKLMRRLGIAVEPCETFGTLAYAAIDGAYAGYILISDSVKPQSADAIKALRSAGIRDVVMLTGDNESAAKQTADALGIEKYYSSLLPEDKVKAVEKLLDRQTGKAKLAFAGDGINDAPVLTRADIGVAMGALGSDAAIEAADVVLMDDDPMKIAKAIGISRRCIAIVYQNIVFALAVKLICLILGALGIADMWAAVFADVGVMVIAVLNAMRALSVKAEI